MDTGAKQAKAILNINELDGVIGGADTGDTKGKTETREMYCDDPRCKKTRVFYLGSGGRAVCSFCHTQILY